ncbi:RHS repeat protein, partial [Actinospica durhamensis]
GEGEGGTEGGSTETGGVSSEGTGSCATGGTDPVDVVSGQMVTATVDVDLPGVLPLVLRRAYASGYGGGRLLGPGWSSTLDIRIRIGDGGIDFSGDDAQLLRYPLPAGPPHEVLPAEGARWPLSWDRKADEVYVQDTGLGLTYRFTAVGEHPAPGGKIRPLTSISDRNGNRIAILRDADGVPTEVQHSAGYRIGVDSLYTAAGFRIQELRLLGPEGADGPDGDTVLAGYGYDPAGRLVQITDGSGVPLIYEYDAHDRITAWIDRGGYRYEYEYDAAGRVVRTGGEDGAMASRLAYDLENRVTTVTNALGHATAYHYDAHQHLCKTVDALGAETTTESDRYGRVLAHTDELGHTTRFMRDAHGDALRIEHPDGTVVEAEYDRLRNPVRITGPDGAVWQYGYDERGNRVSATDPAGSVTAFGYGERGNLVQAVDALGHATSIETDRAGLPVAVTDPLGAVWRTDRDGRGRVVAATGPLGATVTTGYDGQGHPVLREYPDGTRETWTYDACGNQLSHTDQAGLTTAFGYGPFHQILERTDPDGARHAFAHDARLRLTAVTNPQNLTWTYTLDAVGNVVGETDFNGRALTYGYDAAGNVIRRVNGAGEGVDLIRDALGRTVEQRTDDGASTTFGYDPAGRLVRAQGPDGTVVLTRDALGRVLAESYDDRVLTSTYGATGRRLSRTTPGGSRSDWQFDALGRPLSLEHGDGRLSFAYDAAGQEAYRWIGADTALTSEWDGHGRLTAQRLLAVDGPADARTSRLVDERVWTYRADGVPDSVTDVDGGTRRFALDPAGRVTAVTAATWTESYVYDHLGNLVHSADTRTPDAPTAGSSEVAGTLVRRAGRTHYEYDDQSRLIRTVRHTLSGGRREWTFAYDAHDRLTEATNPDGEHWRYRYDPLGRRVSKARLGADGEMLEEIRFSWDGVNLAEQEHVLPGRRTATSWDYAIGSWAPLTQDRRSYALDAPQDVIDREFHAVITDLVGTPTELATADGRIAWRRRTSLWGEPRADADEAFDGHCPLGFPGQYPDTETGLAYNFRRYYDPATGRYTSPDPLGLAPAAHHHGYVDNPLAWLDPLGLLKKPYAYYDRPGYSNYTLQDSAGNTYYSGMFGPGSSQASVERRHGNNHNRYSTANGDTITVEPGTRTYGESRLMEQRLADDNDTIIGRDGNNYRGNRENPMDAKKLADYEEYEKLKNAKNNVSDGSDKSGGASGSGGSGGTDGAGGASGAVACA